jgi:hypothetical protein
MNAPGRTSHDPAAIETHRDLDHETAAGHDLLHAQPAV